MFRLHPALALSAAATLALLSLAGCSSSEASAPVDIEPPAAFASLQPGWNTFEPGGDTICSDGTPFRFFARPGDPDKLLVYFQGGGGCWTGATCDPDKDPTYSIQAISELIEAKPGEPRPERAMNGIFDYTRADNPLGDYSAVFVPYCTGDVHLGNRTVSYQAPAAESHEAHEVTVHHNGFVNAMAALDWTYSAFDAPKTVFVTGSSAGSIPSPYYAHRIKEHYPAARVVQLGDGSGGYRRGADSARPDEQWGTLDVVSDLPYLAQLPPEDFDYEALYIGAAKQHPDVQFAEYDTAEDGVQVRFLTIGGADVQKLQPLLDANRADIEREVDNFVSYTASGDAHTILGRPQVYTYRVGDRSFRDWLSDLAEGKPVDKVHCGECKDAPEDEAESPQPTG
jgi:hypothetical protein